MGIDVSLFDFSAQDYVLRSISSLYLPLLVIFGAALVWFVFHGKFVVTLRRLKTAQSSVQRRSARRFRVVGITATALAVACVLFSLATGLSSPPWPIEPIADALFDHQWVVPATLIFATVTATYAFWARRQLPDSSHSNGSPWQAAVTGAIIASTLALAGFWMLEEYSSAVGLRYANQIADIEIFYSKLDPSFFDRLAQAEKNASFARSIAIPPNTPNPQWRKKSYTYLDGQISSLARMLGHFENELRIGFGTKFTLPPGLVNYK
jgi:hypothetical protein